MGDEILTKCGYRCDLCLAYKPNVEKDDQRQALSDGWFAIYGFRVEPADIVCEGCVSSGNPQLIDDGCPVRPCVTVKKLENCAGCSEYVCGKLGQRIVDRQDLEKKLERKLTEEEYEKYVKPYESQPRLDRIRQSS